MFGVHDVECLGYSFAPGRSRSSKRRDMGIVSLPRSTFFIHPELRLAHKTIRRMLIRKSSCRKAFFSSSCSSEASSLHSGTFRVVERHVRISIHWVRNNRTAGNSEHPGSAKGGTRRDTFQISTHATTFPDQKNHDTAND